MDWLNLASPPKIVFDVLEASALVELALDVPTPSSSPVRA